MSHRVALFAGTFDPYTNGHHAIVKKAAALFDEVVVMLAVNTQKRRAFDATAMAGAIRAAIEADSLNARVVTHDGLVTDYCREQGIRWYVRGLRNAMDYSYEENNAGINRLLEPRLETIYLRGDDPVVSSSLVRELLRFGRPIDAFVPASVGRLSEGDKPQGETP